MVINKQIDKQYLSIKINTFPVMRSIKQIVKSFLPDKIYDHFKNIFYQKIYLHNEKVKLNRRKFKKLPQGINLFIYDLKSSSNKVAHILKQALDNTKIPYHTFDLCDLEKCKSEFKNKKLYNINLVVYHAASNTSMAMLYLGLNAKKYFNIAYFAWELAELPDSYYSSLSMFHEIWSISSFCTAAVAKKSIVPVLTVPHFADPNKAIIKNGRNHFKIDNDVFLFMFAYDCTSYISRKNPQAVVKAFLKAFSPKDRNVGLVLKLNYSNKHKKHVKELKKILSSYPYIYFIEKYLSDVEMRTLIQTSNAVVSLHRSEGFGLLPLEAMSLGTPVISTAWSGNMEYMTHMNTALVSYKLIPVNGKYVGSKPGDSLVWANPNIDEAAIYMRRMVSDQVWREKLIIEGKYTVSKYFNPENISKIIHDRLRFLKLID